MLVGYEVCGPGYHGNDWCGWLSFDQVSAALLYQRSCSRYLAR